MRACLFGVYIFLTHPLSKNLASYLQRHSFPIKFIYLKLGYNFEDQIIVVNQLSLIDSISKSKNYCIYLLLETMSNIV